MKKFFAASTFALLALFSVATAQTLSPDGSSITPSSGGSLVTADGTWTFGTATQSWGTQILLNGQPMNNFANKMIILGGKIYAQYSGTAPGWVVYENGTWTITNDPTQSSGGSSSCAGTLTDYYQPSIATPIGYGASYDLFSSQHELEVSVQNCPANSLTLTVGSNQSNQYIYNKGYLYQSGSWQSINLTGTGLVSNAWYPQIASASLSVTPSSWTYVVGYVCAWSGTVWQCGCATTACTTNYWQLQAFQSGQSAGGGNGGSNGSGAGGQWAGSPDANAIVISPSGNDGNPCNVNSPCQTLERAQQVARSASDKVIYLRAGTYDRSSTLDLNGSDNGETWMTYPGDAVDSAVLDGGSAHILIAVDGVSNLTLNGLKIQHCSGECIYTPSNPRISNIVIENNDIGFNINDGSIGGFPEVIILDNATNSQIKNNYVHDCVSICINMDAYDAGDSVDGDVVSGNFVERCETQVYDGGCIYTGMRNSNITAGHETITDNYVSDYGNSGVQAEGIYLDDDASNVTVTGNVIGPMNPAAAGTGSKNTIINGGCCNTFEGNIIDLGSTGNEWIAGWSGPGEGGAIYFNWTGPNVFQGNIVISNYSGSTVTSGWPNSGQEYIQGAGNIGGSDYPASMGSINGNIYHNYGGGAETTSGNIISDSNPIHEDPQLSGLDYTIAAGSPVRSLSNLPTGGWGPPGFVIPSSSNHSTP
jgi:hypothetical protein